MCEWENGGKEVCAVRTRVAELEPQRARSSEAVPTPPPPPPLQQPSRLVGASSTDQTA